MNTHGPYRVPERHRASLLNRPASREFSYYRGPMAAITSGQDLARRARVPASYVKSLVEQYDTAVRYTTDKLAEVFEALRERGLYDGSLIIVTSDHGEELFDHGGFSHGYTLHEEVLRVPLYVKLPFQREARSVPVRASLMDIHPTVLDALGVRLPNPVDGTSLLPLLRGERRTDAGLERRPLLQQIDWEKRCVARSMLAGRFKLVEIERNYEGLRSETRLYDLGADPRETRNLASQHPDMVARLRREMREAFERYEVEGSVEPENVLDELDAERLRALGYL
jgi:arylsulfatase A-like enzyme